MLKLFDAAGALVQERSGDFLGARFLTEFFDGLPDEFLGRLSVESEEEFFIVALRQETTPSGIQLTSVPSQPGEE